jgi:2-polyprenyl-3-methyl-5-hydroxy-6-metoxy-1,4-benzoquinol methylase
MDAQYAAAYPELYRRHWWWRVREEILLQKIRRMLAHVSRPRILDVGCGAALFFDVLEPFGHVEGIESDRSAVERSGRWRSRIIVGELDDSYEPDAPFDLILMLDVLEHVPDPGRLLQRAGEILTPGGCILVTAPAFNCLWTTHDDMNHHVTRYTARGMRRTIRRAGLAPVETRYMFQSLVVPKLLVRLREALTAGPPRVPGIPPPAVNDAVRSWFRAEYLLAGWLPFGGSLLAVAAPLKTPSRSARQ